MKKYYNYLRYILEHKKNVFVECWKEGLYLHAFTHDFSKFSIQEFIPYARYDFQDSKNNTQKIKKDFEKAWQHHKDNNKHHWNYWQEKGLRMPTEYIRQMICDWRAMSRKFGDTAQNYYLNNYHKINMDRDTRYYTEIHLGLLKYNAPICECNEEYWMTIKELIESSQKHFDTYGEIYGGTVENNINDLLKPICDKYNVNIYKLVKS